MHEFSSKGSNPVGRALKPGAPARSTRQRRQLQQSYSAIPNEEENKISRVIVILLPDSSERRPGGAAIWRFLLDPFDDRGDALTDPDAHGRQAVAAAAL